MSIATGRNTWTVQEWDNPFNQSVEPMATETFARHNARLHWLPSGLKTTACGRDYASGSIQRLVVDESLLRRICSLCEHSLRVSVAKRAKGIGEPLDHSESV